jgi:hypothetical protein
MNDQERQVISDIFRRLEQVANQPRDPEAERLIADKLRQQSYAPYAMAQTIFVQEQALGNLQAENKQLRAELEQAQRQPQQGGGFLSSIFGGGSRPQQHDYRQLPRQASPWGGGQSHYQQPYGQPQGGMMAGGPWGGGGGMMQPRGGGGFLQGALSTAAGVAGGVMIANALSHAFGGGGAEAGGEKTALANTANDAGGDQGADAGNAGITDALYGNDQGGHDDFSDFGGDGGDGGDWT